MGQGYEHSLFIGHTIQEMGDVFMRLNACIDAYLSDCHTRNLRRKTILSYEQTLLLFCKWVEDSKKPSKVSEISAIMINQYIEDITRRGKYTAYSNDHKMLSNYPMRRRDYKQPVTPTTINNYMRNMKAFFNWLVEMNFITRSPMAKIKFLKVNRSPKEFLEDDELTRIIKALDRTYFNEYRDLIIISLILDTGMRIGECLSIKIEQINIIRGSLYLYADKTKGNKDRSVFFGKHLQKELNRWLQYKDRYCNSNYLFPTKAKEEPLSISSFESNFRKYLLRANIEKKYSPHSLRNNFAKRCLINGMDIYTLSKILGHSSVTVTERCYLDLTDEDIRLKYNNFSPFDLLKK